MVPDLQVLQADDLVATRCSMRGSYSIRASHSRPFELVRSSNPKRMLSDVSEELIQHLNSNDPTTNYRCDLLVDTNTVVEALSVGDLLRVGDEIGSSEEIRRSPKFRYRQARARCTRGAHHGYGFNIGSANPHMIVGGDGLVLGATPFDF
jgi:hypothetical protein